jgi:hypothetical protein
MGENAMRLPAINFNHCIVRINLAEGPIFQDLTGDKMPFGCVPIVVLNAQALIIPNSDSDPVPDSLIHITNNPHNFNQSDRTTSVKQENDDLIIHTELVAKGTLSSVYRNHFSGLTNDRMQEEVQHFLRKPFKNNVTIKDYNFSNLDKRNPELHLVANCKAQDEIVTLGGLRAIKPPFFDELFSLDPFPDQERVFPLLYWEYENISNYQDEITIEIQKENKFVELPENVQIKTYYIEYDLSYQKINDNTVKVIRKAKINLTNIPASDYTEFRNTVRKIVKAEDSNIVFK